MNVKALIAVFLAALMGISCTDTSLYSPAKPKKEASRLAMSGRACSEDPFEAEFPIKIVLLVDQAPGPLFSSFDAASQRVIYMNDFVQKALNGDQTEMAVIGYGGIPRKLAPQEGNFTRNPGELFAAVTATSLPQTCAGVGQCRDYREALRTARALIEGDIANTPAGLRVLTQYIIIHVNAGQHEPLADGAECCLPDDTQCQDANMGPSAACNLALSVEEITDLRETVVEQGAAGLRYHPIHFAAEVAPNLAINDSEQAALEQMAFAGGGVYQRYNNIDGVSASAFDLLGLRTVLNAKLLLAANLNAKPGPDGPVIDSDADGLSDAEEESLGTSPGNRDTDFDGISDRVESFAGLDPLVPEDPFPTACQNMIPGADEDLDTLTNCDEALLGTEPTLVDTDGDGMPDPLEVLSGTDYLNRDAENDTDGDGVNNGDELLQHSDPRSTDTRAHLSFGYRYDVVDEGFSRELFASDPERITGVIVTEISDGTTAGIGTLRWNAANRTLAWQDSNDPDPGRPVPVSSGGEFRLTSSSFAAIQREEGKYIRVRVDPNNLPIADDTESIRVVFRDRQCLQYTIRNIQLMPTIALDDDPDNPGINNVLLFFAQGPEGRPLAPGPFRMAQLQIQYLPPNRRIPDDAIILIEDSEYVRPVISPDSGL